MEGCLSKVPEGDVSFDTAPYIVAKDNQTKPISPTFCPILFSLSP